MSTQPIFIHSLFRTGSTYIWNKFRQHSRFYCYYEPFHQEMARLEIPTNRPYIWGYDKKSTQAMGHPDLDQDYLEEYKKLLHPGTRGVPFFKKSFSFDDFCNTADDVNPDQKKYLDHLLMEAGDKIPFLQFNRSAFRVSWFKKNYPYVLHIYLLRNPRHQFQSYMEMYKQKGVDTFLGMDLVTAGVNLHSGIFQVLNSCIPIIEYHSPVFNHERLIYSQLLPVYSTIEKYFIFYFIWFRALMENVLNADMLVNINELSKRTAYRDEVRVFLQSRGIDPIDFSDAHIREYENPVLDQQEMKEIETGVQTLVLNSYTDKQIEQFADRIEAFGPVFVDQGREDLLDLKKKTIMKPPLPRKEMVMEKYVQIFKHFSQQLVSWHYLTREEKVPDKEKIEIMHLKNQLSQRDQELMQKDRKIEQKNQELTQKEQNIEEKDRELNGKAEQLVRKDRQIQQKYDQIEILLKEKNSLLQELTDKEKEMNSLKTELAALTANRSFRILKTLGLIRYKN